MASEYDVYSQGLDLLYDRKESVYATNYTISGIAIHVAKKLLFVSDERGLIIRAPLVAKKRDHQGMDVLMQETVIGQQSELNFKPLLMSVDWLNDHLYVLGEVMHADARIVWQISKCNLDGTAMTIATAGLFRKPAHFEVDPFNGYLYWVVTGNTAESGLYRLDLGDVSNGVKHKVKPYHMRLGSNPGAFVIDHRLSKVLVPLQDANTVVSVAFDG